jgi:hypothetical protein
MAFEMAEFGSPKSAAGNEHSSLFAGVVEEGKLLGKGFVRGVVDESQFDAQHYVGTGARVGTTAAIGYWFSKDNPYTLARSNAMSAAVVGLAMTAGHFATSSHIKDVSTNLHSTDGIGETLTYVAGRFMAGAALTVGSGILGSRLGWAKGGQEQLDYLMTTDRDFHYIPGGARRYGPKYFVSKGHATYTPISATDKEARITTLLSSRNQSSKLPSALAILHKTAELKV